MIIPGFQRTTDPCPKCGCFLYRKAPPSPEGRCLWCRNCGWDVIRARYYNALDQETDWRGHKIEQMEPPKT